MTEILYGVTHGAYDELTGKQINILPSLELIDSLITLSLRGGGKVGIEYTPELENPLSAITFEGTNYWIKILDLCYGLKLTPIYLDDWNIYKKIIGLTKQIYQLENSLNERWQQIPPNINNHDITNKLEKLYIEKQYIFEVEREKAILNNIKVENPDIAIVGQGHGDIFWLQKRQLQEEGTFINNYISENLSPFSISAIRDGYTDKAVGSVSITNANPRVLLERQTLIRQHNAVTTRRILPENERMPEFIGTWNISSPLLGLFEVYIDQNWRNETTGTIEDILGTAQFEGTIGDNLFFNKRYDLDKSLQSGQTVHYKGYRKQRGSWVGEWGINDFSGQFIMKIGSRLGKINL